MFQNYVLQFVSKKNCYNQLSVSNISPIWLSTIKTTVLFRWAKVPSFS